MIACGSKVRGLWQAASESKAPKMAHRTHRMNNAPASSQARQQELEGVSQVIRITQVGAAFKDAVQPD